MMSDEIEKIVELLNSQGRMEYLEPASMEQIAVFEDINDYELPSKFKEWLLMSDGGELFLPAGFQIYGVAHKPLINVYDDNKPDDNYVVIGALASGDPILCEKGSERISIYNSEAGRIEDDEVYPDYFSFLEDLYDLLGMGE